MALFSLHPLRLRLQPSSALADAAPLLERSGDRTIGRFRHYTLDSAFQPIFSAQDHRLFAHEALLRARTPEGHPVSPEEVFATPDGPEDLVLLDRLCRTVHVLNYVNQAIEGSLLFLNLDPRHVRAVANHGVTFEGILRDSGVPPERIVLELLETASDDHDALERAIQNFRARGFRIAVDDFGRGHANFDRLWGLDPDFVKFDRHVVSQAAADPRLGRVLPHLVEVAKARGARVLFEGIERETELALAREAGADFVQGYLLGRPAADCTPTSQVFAI